MKKISALRTRNAGFTLVELLVVIGVLGLLAAGLLAAVDPFEQLKKGRDSNARNVVVELHNSMIRYYATHGELPWCGGVTPCQLNGGASTPLSDAALTTSLDAIVADGELKGADGADFLNNVGAANAAKITVTSTDDVSVAVCFAPESKSLYMDQATKFGNDGVAINGVGEACEQSAKDVTTGIGTCYWCAK